MIQFTDIINDLRKRITPETFTHSLGVLGMSVRLARRWDGDEEKCAIAGLIHDCGKLSVRENIIPECMKYKIELSEEDMECPQVIHAYLSEAIAREVYHIDDEELLAAVRNHTLGGSDMSLTEKIIFTADMTEPGRTGKSFVKLRELAFENLDEALISAYDQTIDYNKRKGNHIHSKTIENKNKLEDILYGCKTESRINSQSNEG